MEEELRWSETLDEREYPDEEPETDSVDVVRCSSCGAEVYEESQACPQCGEFMSVDTSIWSDRRTWWIVLGLLGMAAVTFLLVRGWL